MAKQNILFIIAYDFDGTLAPGNMQEYNFIPALNIEPKDFWTETEKIAKEQSADKILAYMKLMLQKASTAQIPIRKEDFIQYGKDIELFPGVKDWFDRIDKYGKAHGVKVEHFIISSGLREMIKATPIAKKFKKIYASGFMFDENGVANWPALAINYTTKTQYLFRINKGTLEEHDDSQINQINKYVALEKRSVPFENIVFIGDGEADIPCMRLVKDKGGYSIAVYVYNRKKRKSQAKVHQLVTDGRTTLVATANYEENKTIDRAVKAMIDRVVATHTLHEISRKT
ncbi:HAD family hydrolase [Candidatus Nitrosacidococcus tergens]|uniref:Phosphoserine phosphatase n=1 Tax=Candidatus Nitrosacidococcus tergens TaxID=553981 RepID=A0A7G1Q9U5_9GAMM|nr:HAD family hydrolase [Candidatus Nitrosacidococcus tergens]CAB1276011.1 conserved protein of unknown function [Candidatus Nitrosacidococcus tergens]